MQTDVVHVRPSWRAFCPQFGPELRSSFEGFQHPQPTAWLRPLVGWPSRSLWARFSTVFWRPVGNAARAHNVVHANATILHALRLDLTGEAAVSRLR